MGVRQFIRPDITASAIAHLSVLALVVVFGEVHPFGVVTAEPIAVDIVTPDELAQQTKPDSTEKEELALPSQSAEAVASDKPAASASAPAPAASAPAASSAAQAASGAQPQQPAPPNRREAALQQKPQAQPQPAPSQPTPPAQQATPAAPTSPSPPPSAPPASPSLGYTPPEPDLTIKYHVMLGLPGDIQVSAPQTSGAKDKSGDSGDATASSKADVSSSVIAQFRRHLKTCSKLPASIAASDKVMIKLRVLMTPEGKLAADPILMEASASAKGPLLMQSAIAALNSCQPYAMLPSDRYGEWKVIDLSFTPEDFSS
jgi:hypothetical protein